MHQYLGCMLFLVVTATSENTEVESFSEVPYDGANIVQNGQEYHLTLHSLKYPRNLGGCHEGAGFLATLKHKHRTASEIQQVPRRPLKSSLEIAEYAAYYTNKSQLLIYYSGELGPNHFGIGVIFKTNLDLSNFQLPFYSLSDISLSEYEYFHDFTHADRPPTNFILIATSVQPFILLFKYTQHINTYIGSIWLESDGITPRTWKVNPYIPETKLFPTPKHLLYTTDGKFWALGHAEYIFLFVETSEYVCVTRIDTNNQQQVTNDKPIASTSAFKIDQIQWNKNGWPQSKLDSGMTDQDYFYCT